MDYNVKKYSFIGEDEHIYLRRFMREDAAFMQGLMNEKGWLTNIGDRQIHSIEDAQRYLLTGPMQTYKQHNFGLYLVVHKLDNKPLGTCGLLKRSYLSSPDIGFAISEQHTNKGYGFASSKIVLSHANQECGLRDLFATVNKDNKASQGLLKKLGFTQQGLLKVDGEALPLLLYSRVL